MKKFIFFLFFLCAGIGLFYWVIKAVGLKETKEAFLSFSPWQAIVILVLTVVIALIENWKWMVVLRGQEVTLSFRKLWKIYLGSYSVRYFTPVAFVGGEAFRGYFLNKNHSILWIKGIGSVIVDRILTWTANLVIIFLGLGFLLLKIGFPPRRLGIALAVGLLLFGFAMIFFYFKSFKKQSIVKFFFRTFRLPNKNHSPEGSGNRALALEEEIFSFFKPKKKAMWKGLVLSLVRVLVMLLRTGLLVLFLGKAITLLPTMSLLACTLLASMIPIPANIGSHDVAQAFAFGALGLGAGVGTAFAMVIRGAELLVALFGLILLFKIGVELLKNRILRKASQVRLK